MTEQKIEFSDKEQELIEVFQDTYNALYLENFSESKLNYIKLNSNPVYSKLIENLMSKKRSYQEYEYIEGPMSLTKFKLEAEGKPKKSFYIFGEYHIDTRGHCPMKSIQFQDYLKLLSIESPSFLDIYVETSMVKKKIKIKNEATTLFNLISSAMFKNKRVGFNASYKRENKDPESYHDSDSYIISAIQKNFLNCIQPKLRHATECQLIRIHNIDIRNTWDVDKELPIDFGLVFIEEIIEVGLKYTADEITHVIRRTTIGNNLIMDTLNVLKTGNFMDVLFMNKKLKHEIESELCYEKDNIQNFIRNKINKYQEMHRDKIIDICTKLINSLQNKTAPVLDLNNFEYLREVCSDLGVLKVDVYCLSRVFKTYDIKKNNPVGAFQPAESKNIIIYAGNAHSQNYVQFMDYLNEAGYNIKKTYQYINYSNSCVLLNKPKPKIVPVNKERRREEYVEFLNNASISNLKDMANLQGFSIPPRPTKKNLIDLLIEDYNRNNVVDIEVEQKPPAQTEEEKRLEYIEFLNNSSVSNLKDTLSRLGYDIPPRATKKKLIDLLIENYGR